MGIFFQNVSGPIPGIQTADVYFGRPFLEEKGSISVSKRAASPLRGSFSVTSAYKVCGGAPRRTASLTLIGCGATSDACVLA